MIPGMSLTFTTLWANSADDKLIFFLFCFPRKQNLIFHGDNLYEMSFFFWKKKEKNISICRLLKILPRVLSVNTADKPLRNMDRAEEKGTFIAISSCEDQDQLTHSDLCSMFSKSRNILKCTKEQRKQGSVCLGVSWAPSKSPCMLSVNVDPNR